MKKEVKYVLTEEDKLNSKIIHENLTRKRIGQAIDGIWLACVVFCLANVVLYLILKVLL